MPARYRGRIESTIALNLLSRGVDLSRVSSFRQNVLHFAAAGGDRDCVEFVGASSGIDGNSTDADGRMPLMLSMLNNHLRCI
jgi:ankyrin repeat protein